MASQVSELIIRLRDEVSSSAKSVSGSLSSLQRQVSSFAGALGVGLGVGALVGFSKEVFNLASQLDDLSKQTGISGQMLSGLKSPLEESGTSLEIFANGIFTAQKNLGEGSSDIQEATRKLGLEFNQLKNASPEGFLKLIAGALAKIEDPIERNALGAQLLGRSFRELSPALSEIAGKLDQLKASGMTDAQIQKLHKFANAVVRIENALKAFGAIPLGVFADFITNLFDPEKMIKSIIKGFEKAPMAMRKPFVDFEDQLDPTVIRQKLARTDEDIAKLAKEMAERVKKAAGDSRDAIDQMDKDVGAGLAKTRDEFLAEGTSVGEVFQKQVDAARKTLDELVRQPFPAEFEFQQLADRAAALQPLFREFFGINIPPALQQAINDFRQLIELTAQEKGFQIKADPSNALGAIGEVRSQLENLKDKTVKVNIDMGGSRRGIERLPSGKASFTNEDLQSFFENVGDQTIEGPTFKPTAEGSPELPLSDYFNNYAVGVVQNFADKASQAKINLGTDISQMFGNVLGQIIDAKERIASFNATPFRADFVGDFAAGPSARLAALQDTLKYIEGLAMKSAVPSAASGSSGGSGGNTFVIDLRGATISQELLDRKLVPAFEAAVRSATGQQVNYRVLN